MKRRSTTADPGLFRLAMAVVLAVVAACGTDSGMTDFPHHAAEAPVTATTATSRQSSQPMAKGLRAAYVASVQREASESYAPMAVDELVRMQNPAQRFVTTVARNGLRVIPEGDAWHLGMRTVALGCEGAMVPVADAAPEVQDGRVEVRRERFDEWYINGPLGVEQGFVLKEPPTCAGPKTIEMAVDGDVVATLDDPDGDERGDTARFVDGEGRAVASYTDVFVTDATGKALSAWLSVNAHGIALVVDDAGAAYPLSIDPLVWVQQSKLLASDGQSADQFGISVSLSGDMALVGAYLDDDKGTDSGSAYVFVRNGTTWSEQAKLVPMDGAAGDYFGVAVSLVGDTALIGAYHDGDKGPNSGSAYVFVRSGTTWTQQAKLLAIDGTAYDEFGSSLSLSGDTALIGASYDTHPDVDMGSAYVFVRNGTAWTQQAKLVASDAAAVDRFGYSVSLSGDTALVGAWSDGDNGTYSGSAYVFVRNGATWTEQAKLLASDGTAGDRFGSSVSLSADTALVGATMDDDKGANSGSAYVFVRNGAAWTEQAKLVPGDGATIDYFGSSVSLSGDTALVGAYIDDDMGKDSGSAYVFVRNGATWTEQAKLLASDGAANDHFGLSVSLSGDTALVGAHADSDLGVASGSAYVFVLRKGNGDACAAATECASGFCTEGVCCDSACGNGDATDCQACSMAAGAAVDGACAPLTAGTECRASEGACDAAEVCDGMTSACPADAKAAAGTECRASLGACDAAEVCDGMTDVCPADAKYAAGTECRASAGACDVAEACDGSTDACPTDGFVATGTECRAAAGSCDVAESCSGSSAACPVDTKVAAGTQCRASAGACDAAEACDGSTDACPVDTKVAAGTQCRASAGACDAAEACDGSTDACPVDTKVAAGTQCRASAGACDVAEACDGSTDACPTDGFVAAGTECRAAAGSCDVAESCSGSSAACPVDTKVAAGTQCRASAGACDAAEACDGSTDACPTDAKVAAGTECRAAAGACDAAEACDGSTDACPTDGFVAAGTECRAAAGSCDVAESCSGSSAVCPADEKVAAGTECRASAGACDVAEACDGMADACPADGVAAAGAKCRAAAGVCDAAESCDGASIECPADASLPDDTACPEGACIAGVCTNNPTMPEEGGGCACFVAPGMSSKSPWSASLACISFALLALRRRSLKRQCVRRSTTASGSRLDAVHDAPSTCRAMPRRW